MLELSQRLKTLPSHASIEIRKKGQEAIAKGIRIISLRLGNPDMPTPSYIVSAMQKAVANPKYHQYPSGHGFPDFLQAVAQWYKRRFDVDLTPESEICSLIGCKEGITHLPLALVNPGDFVLVPDPGYPAYRKGAILAGGKVHYVPLIKDNGFLPDLDSIPDEVLKRAKLFFLNYPNNPLAVTAPRSFLETLVSWVRKHQILVAFDATYSEIYFDAPPLSFLSIPGAKDVGIEFHSLSKTYNMAGWRIGWACGNAKAISALFKIKDNYDSGAFYAVQEAGSIALSDGDRFVENLRETYRERRDVFVRGLQSLGWKVDLPQATFYV